MTISRCAQHRLIALFGRYGALLRRAGGLGRQTGTLGAWRWASVNVTDPSPDDKPAISKDYSIAAWRWTQAPKKAPERTEEKSPVSWKDFMQSQARTRVKMKEGDTDVLGDKWYDLAAPDVEAVKWLDGGRAVRWKDIRDTVPAHLQQARLSAKKEVAMDEYLQTDVVKSARLRRLNAGTLELDHGISLATYVRGFVAQFTDLSSWEASAGLDNLQLNKADTLTLRFHKTVTNSKYDAAELMEAYRRFAEQDLKMAVGTAKYLIFTLAKERQFELVAEVLKTEKFSDLDYLNILRSVLRKLAQQGGYADWDSPSGEFADRLVELLEKGGRTRESSLIQSQLFPAVKAVPDLIPPNVSVKEFNIEGIDVASMRPQDRNMYRQIMGACRQDFHKQLETIKAAKNSPKQQLSIPIARAIFLRLIQEKDFELADELALDPFFNRPGSQVIALLGVTYLKIGQNLVNHKKRGIRHAYDLVKNALLTGNAELVSGADLRAGIAASEGMATLSWLWEYAMRLNSAPALRTRELFLRKAVDVGLGLRQTAATIEKQREECEQYCKRYCEREWRQRLGMKAGKCALLQEEQTSRLHGMVCSVVLAASEEEQRELRNSIASVLECWIWRWQRPEQFDNDFRTLMRQIPYFADFLATLPFDVADEALSLAIYRSTSNARRNAVDPWPTQFLWPLIGSISRLDTFWNNPSSKTLLAIEYIISSKSMQRIYLAFRSDEWIAGFMARELFVDFWRHKKHYDRLFAGEGLEEYVGFVRTGILPGQLVVKSDEEVNEVNFELYSAWEGLGQQLKSTPEQIRLRETLGEDHVFVRAVKEYLNNPTPIPAAHYLSTLVYTLLRSKRYETATRLVSTMEKHMALPQTVMSDMLARLAHEHLPFALQILNIHPNPQIYALANLLQNRLFVRENPEEAIRILKDIRDRGMEKPFPFRIRLARPRFDMFDTMMNALVRTKAVDGLKAWEYCLEVIRVARKFGYKPGSEDENLQWFLDTRAYWFSVDESDGKFSDRWAAKVLKTRGDEGLIHKYFPGPKTEFYRRRRRE